MARLSWPGWLATTYRDKYPAPEIEPGYGHPPQYRPSPTLINFVDRSQRANQYARSPPVCILSVSVSVLIWPGCGCPSTAVLPPTNAAVVIHLVASVCNALIFGKLWPRKFIFDMHVRHQRIHVMFVYQGHRIKVKVTGAKNREISFTTPFYDRRGAVSLQLQWRQVHFSFHGMQPDTDRQTDRQLLITLYTMNSAIDELK